MIVRHHAQQGWLRSRPFFWLPIALLFGCAHQPRMTTLADAQDGWTRCAPTGIAGSRRFAFDAFETGLPQKGQWRDSFDLADMDGDGHLDLLHGPARKGLMQPTIFLGDGKGHFEPWARAHFPPLAYDYGDVKAADLNRDGRMDFALSSHLRGLVTLISEGNGHYAPWGEGLGLQDPADVVGAPLFSSRGIALADWDGDGLTDLLAANEGPARMVMTPLASDALAIFLNRRGFWERAQAAQVLRGFGDALAVGDLDGDQRMDAVVGTQRPGAHLLWQRGSASGAVPTQLHMLPDAATVTAVAITDLDRDDRKDLLTATRATTPGGFCSGLQTMVQVGGGSERSTALWRQFSTDTVVAITHGDIDADGHTDLVALRRSGAIMMFAGSDKGFRADVQIATPPEYAGCDGFDARLADLDHNGDLELLVSFAGEDPGTAATRICDSRGGFKAWQLGKR